MMSGKEYQAGRDELEKELALATRAEEPDENKIENIRKEIRDYDKKNLTGQTDYDCRGCLLRESDFSCGCPAGQECPKGYDNPNNSEGQ